ncbi:DUF1936 domain-containing protein [Burkholderia sp. WTPI3]|uniref:DUF1936 domain-containing protein n=1 Tax=Burkholderia sp. WTPI3 TaxID=2822167 RepID=UPI001F31A1FF|nr:DUF1936 domain-containing protein [Burkholderia sp. WTPI3]
MEKQTVRLVAEEIAQAKALAEASNMTVAEWYRETIRDRIAGASAVTSIQRGFAEALRNFQRDIAAVDQQRHQVLVNLMAAAAEKSTGAKPVEAAKPVCPKCGVGHMEPKRFTKGEHEGKTVYRCSNESCRLFSWTQDGQTPLTKEAQS